MSEKKKYIYNRKCIVESCDSVGENGFVKFPKDPTLKERWLQVLNLAFVRPGDRLCRRHFLKSDFGKTRIKRNVIPSQYLVRFASIRPKLFQAEQKNWSKSYKKNVDDITLFKN